MIVVALLPEAEAVPEMWQQIVVGESPEEVEAEKKDEEVGKESAAVATMGLCLASQLR